VRSRPHVSQCRLYSSLVHPHNLEQISISCFLQFMSLRGSLQNAIATVFQVPLSQDMGEVATKDEPSGFRGLQSNASLKRLSLISNLRSRGVGDHINLPQLIVSGDQSTGKSSVLEGITGVPFPRQVRMAIMPHSRTWKHGGRTLYSGITPDNHFLLCQLSGLMIQGVLHYQRSH
jgi:hypothetical protein